MSCKTFDQSLQRLQNDVLVLGSMVQAALQEAVAILKRQDTDAARRLIANDRFIDEKRYAIEAEALMLIATQQPMAVDVRILAAVLFIVNELERIGDYAKGIARITIRIGNDPFIKPLIDIPRMEALARDMLQRSLQAFIQSDIDVVRSIIADDDRVDQLYEQVYRELMIIVLQDAGTMRQANFLLWAAHNLERAADRVTNICERVIYCVTGELIDTGWEEDEVPQYALMQ